MLNVFVLFPTGATVFAKVWDDPANPKWDDDVRFPEGSVVFKILMTDASDKELPFMKNSPTWKAVSPLQYDSFMGH